MPKTETQGTALRGAAMELTPLIGVGMSDLHHAVRSEVARILKQSRGNPRAQSKLLIAKLRDMNLINNREDDVLNKLVTLADESGNGKRSGKEAYLESRELLTKMLTEGRASPVALVIASSAVGSYSMDNGADGSDTVTIAKKSNTSWESRGTLAGAIIGGALGGAVGGAIGGAVGGLVGAAVDECKGK
jgi:hypothetical protein